MSKKVTSIETTLGDYFCYRYFDLNEYFGYGLFSEEDNLNMDIILNGFPESIDLNKCVKSFRKQIKKYNKP